MSLTAHLLHNLETHFPQGTVTFHGMDNKGPVDRSGMCSDYVAGMRQKKLDNLEKIHQAIARGATTIATIAERVGLSISTVKHAVVELDSTTPPRLVRDRSGRVHTFKVAA